ncbi:hypothetical protein NOK12_01210 [Nocardioides sp. OK12]|uniref:Uncharacterized protein n=1 Tax=Nocardioides marinisabuli TaxID=419476 RepID=A0A7Y9F1J6_9ACTN|nr:MULTISPECIES: hypothetical protein [Nocardioides]NYD57927.1 hypothetical protein [Nocardioides marinisabuli]GHJ57602.1 hypothetical protein NOK12_01210 [Nocardioides sp. OK12]
MIGSIVSRFLGKGGGRRPAGGGMGGGMGAGAGRAGGSSSDAAIGRGVKGLLGRFMRR